MEKKICHKINIFFYKQIQMFHYEWNRNKNAQNLNLSFQPLAFSPKFLASVVCKPSLLPMYAYFYWALLRNPKENAISIRCTVRAWESYCQNHRFSRGLSDLFLPLLQNEIATQIFWKNIFKFERVFCGAENFSLRFKFGTGGVKKPFLDSDFWEILTV